jgi:hypothetical protein
MKYRDFPFDDCAKKAGEMVSKGFSVFQKFTCAKCGSRQTIETPNTFHTSGRCEECQHVTDIKARGCNYMLMSGKLPPNYRTRS